MRILNVTIAFIVFTIAVNAIGILYVGGTFGQRCAEIHPKGSSEWNECVKNLSDGTADDKK